MALNLVRAFSLPALNRAEEAQRKADSARRLAMAMAILSQTRLAALRYDLVAEEYLIWKDATHDDDLIVGYLASSNKAGIDTELELLRARARALESRMNRDLAYSILQASEARLYHSIGFDAASREEEGKAVQELAKIVETRFAELERSSFTRPPAPTRASVSIGPVKGLPPPTGDVLRKGVRRVLELSDIPVFDAKSAELRMEIDAQIDAAKEGRRGARVAVMLLRANGAAAGSAEFKTTTSEPMDDEQLEALGEGAAYRVLDRLLPLRARHSSLRMAESLDSLAAPRANAIPEDNPALQGAPLRLRAEIDLKPVMAGAVRPGE